MANWWIMFLAKNLARCIFFFGGGSRCQVQLKGLLAKYPYSMFPPKSQISDKYRIELGWGWGEAKFFGGGWNFHAPPPRKSHDTYLQLINLPSCLIPLMWWVGSKIRVCHIVFRSRKQVDKIFRIWHSINQDIKEDTQLKTPFSSFYNLIYNYVHVFNKILYTRMYYLCSLGCGVFYMIFF